MVLGFITVGPGEMAVIALIALVLFGPDKLPEIGKQIGLAYRELNRLRGDVQRALDIDEYTRFELPDISTSIGQTYTYTPSEYAADGFETTYATDSADGHESSLALSPPPGPPIMQSLEDGEGLLNEADGSTPAVVAQPASHHDQEG